MRGRLLRVGRRQTGQLSPSVCGRSMRGQHALRGAWYAGELRADLRGRWSDRRAATGASMQLWRQAWCRACENLYR